MTVRLRVEQPTQRTPPAGLVILKLLAVLAFIAFLALISKGWLS